jgi:hypothetical protein
VELIPQSFFSHHSSNLETPPGRDPAEFSFVTPFAKTPSAPSVCARKKDMATLTKEQEQAVARWAEEGATLNDIQARLKSEFDVTVTYLDARLLVMGLGVSLKEKKKDSPPEEKPEATPAPQAVPPKDENALLPASGAPGGKVSVVVDQLAVPGTMVSGKATFSDGTTASWYLDQMGRLGLKASTPGYQPPAADIPVFQQELDLALQRAGF